MESGELVDEDTCSHGFLGTAGCYSRTSHVGWFINTANADVSKFQFKPPRNLGELKAVAAAKASTSTAAVGTSSSAASAPVAATDAFATATAVVEKYALSSATEDLEAVMAGGIGCHTLAATLLAKVSTACDRYV